MATKELVSEKLATEEIDKWLVKNRVRSSKIAASTETISVLAKCIMYGELAIDSDGVMIQKLQYPVNGVSELRYSGRATVESVSKKTAKITGNAGFAMSVAYINSITGIPMATIEELDTSDMELATMIIGFF